MKGAKTQLTNAPEGFEYYRVCDREGVCRVVRGMWAAKHLIEDMPELTANRTRSTNRNGAKPFRQRFRQR